jgi:hypothetical protein
MPPTIISNLLWTMLPAKSRNVPPSPNALNTFSHQLGDTMRLSVITVGSTHFSGLLKA